MINIIHVTTGTPAKSPPKKYLKVLSLIKFSVNNLLSHTSPNQVYLNKISLSIINIFKEDPKEVEMTLSKALDDKDNSRSLHYYTSKLNKSFSHEKKLLLIEVLWEVILADNEIHDFESNLLRRLAGLLYISDIECGNAKKRAKYKVDNL